MSSAASTELQYDAKFDLSKFVLSLFVLAIHSHLYPMVLYPWLRVAVPLFFMLSSFFLFSKVRDSSFEKGKVVIRKFVLRNLQLYVSWSIILFPITIYKSNEKLILTSFFDSILSLLKSLIFKGTFSASWFIPAIIIGVIIIYLLSMLIRNDCVVLLFSVCTFCVVTLASSYTSLIESTWMISFINGYKSIFGSRLMFSFPAAIFWVFIGKMIAERRIQIGSVWLLIGLILCSCIGLYIEWKYAISLDGSFNNDSYFMLAPLCVFLFLGIQKIKPIYWKYSVHLKRASTIVYVTHASVLRIISKLTHVLFDTREPLLLFVLTFFSCVFIYLSIVYAIKICRSHRIRKILKMLY